MFSLDNTFVTPYIYGTFGVAGPAGIRIPLFGEKHPEPGQVAGLRRGT